MSTQPGIHARDADGGWTLLHPDCGGETYHLHDVRDLGGVGTRGQDPDGTPLLALSRTEAEMLLADPPPAVSDAVGAIVRAVRQHLAVTGQRQVTLRQVFPADDTR